MPLISVFLLMLFFENRVVSVRELIGRGELLIICIPISISVIYSLYENKRSVGFPFGLSGIFFMLIGFFLLLSILFYGYGYNRSAVVNNYLMVYSFIFLCVTTVSAFFAKYEAETISSLKEDRFNEQKNLEDKFNGIK